MGEEQDPAGRQDPEPPGKHSVTPLANPGRVTSNVPEVWPHCVVDGVFLRRRLNRRHMQQQSGPLGMRQAEPSDDPLAPEAGMDAVVRLNLPRLLDAQLT